MSRGLRLLRGALLTLLVLGLIEAGARVSVGNVARLPAFFKANSEGPGYGLTPGRHRYWHRDRAITVEIEASGFRRVPGAPATAPRTIWLIGDSQVFGWGLDDRETIATRLQALLGPTAKVVNAGMPGYGPVAYTRVIRTAPADAVSVVMFTETNDGQDAFSTETFGMAHCGILVAPEGIGRSLPCWFLRSHLFSTAVDLRNVIAPSQLAPPLNCNPTLRSSSAVIATRIRDTEDVLDKVTAGRALTATVPWDARLEAKRLRDYVPRLNKVACNWHFPDRLGLVPHLTAHSDGGQLFQHQDHHLSARGADAVARHLAARLAARPEPAAQAPAAD
ncbi:MAG: hypothetical protein J0M21_11880, partial [Xanthomonadales bacterium]|nr:hypothetical protein [Xanthomonadales bacterium]